jgi:hypothetical protein
MLLTGAFEPVDQNAPRRPAATGSRAKPFEPQIVIARVKEAAREKAPRGRRAVAPHAPDHHRAPPPAEPPPARRRPRPSRCRSTTISIGRGGVLQ